MRTTLSCLLLTFLYFKGFASDYYSQGSVSPNLLTSWNSRPQGGESTPTCFTNSGDRFIIQPGHAMVTTASWIFGNNNSTLIIQNGGTLQGDHPVLFTGNFQIDDGGSYIHNNTGTVGETAGASIFGGNEVFAPNSHFEIRRWRDKAIGLPNASPGISWGDLI